MKALKITLKSLGFLAFVAGYIFLAMTLWNQLIPNLFHLPMISFWQTLGLIVLLKMLFLGHGWGRCHHRGHKKFRKRGKAWKKHFKAKMEHGFSKGSVSEDN